MMKNLAGIALVLVVAVLVSLALDVVLPEQPRPPEPRPAGARPPPAPPTTGRPQETRTHVYAGLPRSSRPVPVKLLENKGYIAGYSEQQKNPLWVAYRLFRVDNPPLHPSPDQFSADERTEAKVSPADYTGSGYQPGQMAPAFAIDSRYGEQAQRETFLMSNVCPQKPDPTRHVWQALETKVAKDYANRFEKLWVICGPVFGEHIERFKSGVDIPARFYEIVVREEAGRVRVLAFIVPQDAGINDRDDLAKFLTSVDEIEWATGLDFLPDLPDDVENSIEAEKAKTLW